MVSRQALAVSSVVLLALAGCIGPGVTNDEVQQDQFLQAKAAAAAQLITPTSLTVSPSAPGSDANPTISGLSSPGVGVSLFGQADCGGDALNTVNVNVAGGFSLTSPALSDGLFTFSVEATDVYGNVACSATSVVYDLDTSLPTVAFTGGGNGNAVSYSQSATYTISFGSEDPANDPIASSTLGQTPTPVVSTAFNGQAACLVTATQGADIATWSVTLSECSGTDTVSLLIPAGAAIDLAGNRSVETQSSPSLAVQVQNPPAAATFSPAAQHYATASAMVAALSSPVLVTFSEAVLNNGGPLTTADWQVAGTGSCLNHVHVASVAQSGTTGTQWNVQLGFDAPCATSGDTVTLTTGATIHDISTQPAAVSTVVYVQN